MKFLFAWELGGNLGHILRQRLVARKLRQRGHTVSFYLKDMHIGAIALADEDFHLARAPQLNANLRHAHRDISSYGDILASKGFGQRAVIEPVIGAWHAIFTAEQPDVVMLDHAPAALAAARLAGIPSYNVGTGFEIPPPIGPYLSFRPEGGPSRAMLAETENQILATLNNIATAHGARHFDCLSAWMRADQESLITFAEFDHYPERQGGSYLGPLFDVEHGAHAAWPATGLCKNIFVYVRPHETLTVLLDSLTALEANVICYIPGLPDELQVRYATARFQIYTSALRLDRLLPACDLVVCHTAHGLLSACICYGVPVLGIPTQMEQHLLSQRMVEAGNGLFLSRREAKAKLGACLEALLGEPKYMAQAAALARKYGAHDREQVVTTIADDAEQLARGALCCRRRPRYWNVSVLVAWL